MLFFPSISRAIIGFFFFLALIFVFTPDASYGASACTHYASPTGTGNGLSATQPFKVSSFWSLAKPGSTLCLLNGQYTGPASMITPPSGLSGTASAPVTVRALEDGAVLIDGETVRNPIIIRNNHWWVIEGINAANSSGTTFLIDDSTDVTVRRVCAWNASLTTSSHVFTANNSDRALFEDVCAFGTGRKMFEGIVSDGVIFRRAWGQWSQNTSIGPKMVYSLAYQSANATCENCIGTWDETAMGSTPIDQTYTILGTGNQKQTGCKNIQFLGSLAYIRAQDKLTSFQGMTREANALGHCFTYKDVVTYIEPGTHTNIKQHQLLNGDGTDYFLTNSTEVGGSTSSIQNKWTVTNHVNVDTISAMNTAGANPFQASVGNGARLCKRYENGVLTHQPLWPWPMDQRIRAALTLAGKNPNAIFGGTGKTLTTMLESIFGTIPSSCKTSALVVTVPTPPMNLIVSN